MIVTSRLIGYDPEKLRQAGFTHATLEDFDDDQIAVAEKAGAVRMVLSNREKDIDAACAQLTEFAKRFIA